MTATFVIQVVFKLKIYPNLVFDHFCDFWLSLTSKMADNIEVEAWPKCMVFVVNVYVDSVSDCNHFCEF